MNEDWWGGKRPRELDVSCPWCGSPPHEWCRARGTNDRLKGWHWSRMEAARGVDEAPGGGSGVFG